MAHVLVLYILVLRLLPDVYVVHGAAFTVTKYNKFCRLISMLTLNVGQFSPSTTYSSAVKNCLDY
jgi:hypothetical protein